MQAMSMLKAYWAGRGIWLDPLPNITVRSEYIKYETVPVVYYNGFVAPHVKQVWQQTLIDGEDWSRIMLPEWLRRRWDYVDFWLYVPYDWVHYQGKPLYVTEGIPDVWTFLQNHYPTVGVYNKTVVRNAEFRNQFLGFLQCVNPSEVHIIPHADDFDEAKPLQDTVRLWYDVFSELCWDRVVRFHDWRQIHLGDANERWKILGFDADRFRMDLESIETSYPTMPEYINRKLYVPESSRQIVTPRLDQVLTYRWAGPADFLGTYGIDFHLEGNGQKHRILCPSRRHSSENGVITGAAGCWVERDTQYVQYPRIKLSCMAGCQEVDMLAAVDSGLHIYDLRVA